MITSLRMRNFKNFRDAELQLGPLTVLIGANASGKSNIRDAFRFLHGVGRGYTLAEIIGGKFGEGGERQWGGIRGGVNNITYFKNNQFELNITTNRFRIESLDASAAYGLGILQHKDLPSTEIASEYLEFGEFNILQFKKGRGMPSFTVSAHSMKGDKFEQHALPQALSGEADRPLIWKATEKLRIFHEIYDNYDKNKIGIKVSKDDEVHLKNFNNSFNIIKRITDNLHFMSFLDLSPTSMREPALPGQPLGDRGENLSSVLQAICDDPQQKRTLLSWIHSLTPMEVRDFDFVYDQIGRVLVTLIEADGRRTSAYSASDGTLRFLAILAAVFGPDAPKLYFIEEIENGIHPTRLGQLVELIERVAAARGIQVVATTHAPYLLGYLSRESLEHASIVYRTEGRPDARIERIVDIPHAMEVIEKQDIMRLHASGWFEDILAFADAEA